MAEIIITIILIAIVSVVSLEFCAYYLKAALKSTSQIVDLNYAQQEMENLYMNGNCNVGSNTDNPATGITRTWSTTNSAYYTTYVILTVNVQS